MPNILTNVSISDPVIMHLLISVVLTALDEPVSSNHAKTGAGFGNKYFGHAGFNSVMRGITRLQ